MPEEARQGGVGVDLGHEGVELVDGLLLLSEEESHEVGSGLVALSAKILGYLLIIVEELDLQVVERLEHCEGLLPLVFLQDHSREARSVATHRDIVA